MSAATLPQLRSFLAIVAMGVVLTGCGESGRESAPLPTTTRPAQTEPDRPAQPRREARHPRRTDSPLRRLRVLAERHPHDERLTEVARAMLPLEAKVWCWSEQRWAEIERDTNSALPPQDRSSFAGMADLYAYQIHLAPWVCEALSYEGLDGFTELEVADALLVLAHETRHLSAAGSNERVVECKGLQRVAQTAELFGLSRNRARRLARIAWEDVYPTVPPSYRSRECRPGGTLDEDPADPAFP